MEQETYLDRIKKLKSSRKITNDKLSEMTGIPLGTLSKLLAGISDSPKLSNIVAISHALDCSLDWLITGVPENTNNYTLEPAEMTLVETYRSLDSYGQALTLAVMDMEHARTERQADETAIRLHDLARRTAVRGGSRIRRKDDRSGTATEIAGTDAGTAVAFGIADSASVASADRADVADRDETARVMTVMTAVTAMSEAPLQDTPAAAQASAATVNPFAGASVIRGGAGEGKLSAPDAEPAIPRSTLGRSSGLPAGLRRRCIGLYDMPVSAGAGEFLADSTCVENIVIPDDPRTAEADYALRINGDSMEPKYHSGDILLIQTAEAVEEGELGIFVLDGSGYFKKYGGDHLISLNPQYAPIPLKDFENVACCGRVVGKLKKK